MKPEVLVVCGDAGGAAAVAPVAELLIREGRVNLRSAVYRQAAELWARRGLPHQTLAAGLSDGDLAALAGSADALLLGTSVNGEDYERRLGALFPARAVAVLDFWSNYAPRFRSAAGVLEPPAVVCVMDESARSGMAAEGFEAARVVVTGQPAFDALAGLRRAFGENERKSLRATLGVVEGERLVVFASQPLAEFYAQPELRARHPGYDQGTALRLLIAALEELAPEIRRNIVLLVRPHPREEPGSLAWAARSTETLRVRVDGSGDSRTCLLAADLVCGMTSVILVEACHLGCPTLSLQPGLAGPDPLPTNSAGLSRLVRTAAELRETLRDFLCAGPARAEQKTRQAGLSTDGEASRRVADMIYWLLNQRKAR